MTGYESLNDVLAHRMRFVQWRVHLLRHVARCCPFSRSRLTTRLRSTRLVLSVSLFTTACLVVRYASLSFLCSLVKQVFGRRCEYLDRLLSLYARCEA